MPSSGFQTCALRSEEHTSELQSHDNLVCRLLLEKNLVREVEGGFHEVVGRLAHILDRRVRVGLAEQRETIAHADVVVFFNDTAPTEIYTLSLHDALPINDTATTEIYPLSLHDALPISVVAVS